jgi:hypothetical protein
MSSVAGDSWQGNLQVIYLERNLASTYRSQERWKEVEELEVVVMETYKGVLGAEHPDTLTSMSNLVWTYRNRGR